MQNFVNDNFKIDIFLDTNILVDYVLETNPILTHSIDYLNNKRSVRLHSSHYVEFELAEVLKICIFGYTVLGHYPDKKEKSQIKSNNWCVNGTDYTQKMQEIADIVNEKINMLKNSFENLFDDHVLHDKLITPTCNLFLHSNISKEDSLVTTSCIFPEDEKFLKFAALLSNDKQFCSAINKNKATLNNVMCSEEFNELSIMYAKNLNCSSINSQFNIYNYNETHSYEFIESFWNKKILELVKIKNRENFIGETYKHGKANTISGECIYFSLQGSTCLNNTHSLLFFTNDAEETISIKIKIKNNEIVFWNAEHPISLPNNNPDNLLYSFKPLEGILDFDEFTKLREPNNLVFYLNE